MFDDVTLSPHPRAARDPSPATPTPAPPPGRRVRARRGPPSQPRTVFSSVKRAARDLRARSTPSEQILWGALRGGRLAGLKFRRQHPMGRFVLDFYCPEIRLAVEVDGDVHDAIHVADDERQTILESMGIRFVRLLARLVDDDLQSALLKVERAAFRHPSPHTRERGRPQGGGEG
jgi:very-short-patch-repair endonuclease